MLIQKPVKYYEEVFIKSFEAQVGRYVHWDEN